MVEGLLADSFCSLVERVSGVRSLILWSFGSLVVGSRDGLPAPHTSGSFCICIYHCLWASGVGF